MPIATVGTSFSMRETVRGEQVARSCNLSNTEISAQSGQPNLFTYNLHLLLQFSWQLGTHCTFCHSSTYHIICEYKGFTLFYDRLQHILVFSMYGYSKLETCL